MFCGAGEGGHRETAAGQGGGVCHDQEESSAHVGANSGLYDAEILSPFSFQIICFLKCNPFPLILKNNSYQATIVFIIIPVLYQVSIFHNL